MVIKGKSAQLKTMLKLCSKFGWELKKTTSSREKAGSHLFVGDVFVEFYCERNVPINSKWKMVCFSIRSDGTVELHDDTRPLHIELRETIKKAGVTHIPSRKLGSGIK